MSSQLENHERHAVVRAMGSPATVDAHERASRWPTELLNGLGEVTEPFGGLRPQAGRRAAAASARSSVDTALAARLQRLAVTEGWRGLLGVAWALVLARVSLRDEVVFGACARGSGDAAALPTCSLLKVAVDARGAGDVVRQTESQAVRHLRQCGEAAVGFDQLGEHAAWLTSLLVYRPLNMEAVRGDTVQALLPAGAEDCPLVLAVYRREDGLSIDVQVQAPVDPQRVCGMMEQALRSLVEVLEDAPQTPVGQLEVMPEVERQLVLQGWNQTAQRVPEDLCLHELVEVQAARQSAAVAVVHGERRLSYGELNEQANRLAHELRRLGVKPDERVGLCCERGLELAVGLLAVLKAGGAYVPLDPAYPKERLQYMLQDSAPVVVLVQGLGRERIDAAVPVLDLQDAAGWVHQPSTNPSRSAIGLQPSHLAYVIYTSGSTGQPKGVAIEHRNAVNFLSWAAEAFDTEQLKHTLWATSVNFDLAVYEYFAPLSVGTTVEVVGNALEAGQATGEVTLINTVPSALQALLESDQVPASVKTVNLAGEALKRSLVEALFERTGVEQVCNLYGPSETTTYSTWVEMKREDGFVPHIGRPIANTQIYLLDAQGRPVPVGVPGEIHIGGAGVARGYLNRPELTAERFLKDPFASDPQARMYKTGDLGRWLADGQLEYLGRNDHQVKIRGFRIELGEIEARLAQHGSVREAVVLAREDQPGDKRLVAYVTPQWQADENEARRLGHEQVADWSRVWAQTYEQTPEAQDAEFDHFGWNSSYTRLPIPEVQMREWLQGAVGRIQALRPRRVLEIGVGSGMILYGVAPQCERYVGTDLSARTVQQLSRRLQADERLRDRTQVVQAQAADFTGVKGQGGYDTVILNSVLQYFPSLQYLQEVVEQAVEVLDEAGGQLFIGDVRHHGLQEVFQLSVQLYQAPPELPLGQLAGRVAQKVKGELELLVEPEWFVQLKQRQPRIRQVQVLPKQSGYHNEMSAYRYDVVVEVGPAGAVAPSQAPAEIDWIDAQGLDAEALLAKLEAAAQPVIGLYAVRNRRVERDVVALQRLRAASSEASAGELRESLQAQVWSGLGCEELASWCRERGWSVEFSWYPSRADGAWHAVVSRDGRKVQPDWSTLAHELQDGREPSHPQANDPLRAKRLAALPEQLRQHLLGQLPEYMVPAAYVVLEALPLTPNGKLDRQALPAPEGAGQGLREYELPVGEVESCLAQIWAELLKVERVGRHDHFFELGGHSLLAVRMASRLRQALGVEVGLAALFERPVLSAFAQLVKDGTRSELPPIEPVARQPGGQALSFAQQRLWFLSQLEGVSRAYHIPLGYRLVGALQEAALQQALQRIVQRHEALRTSFELVDGVPVQRIAEPQDVQVPLKRHDLRGLAPQQRQQALQQLQQAEADEAFDLKRGPLLRGRLVRLDEQERVLLLTMHHIVSDGWSLEVLTQELAALYQAYSEGRQDEEGVVAELAIQYADYAAWQRCWLSGEVLQAQTAYWQRTLAGAPVLLELPSDRPRPAQQDHRGATVALELEAGLTQALKALSQRHGTTLFMTVLTAWAVVLARLSGQAEVVIGTPVANRQRSEVEPLIGFFANTLALRVDVSGAPSVGQLLQRVKARTLDAQHHQDLPFEQVVELVKPPRSLAHSPLFQVAYTWQNTPAGAFDLAGLESELLPEPEGTCKFDMTLNFVESGARVMGGLEYATALFDRGTAQRYVAYLMRVLAEMAADDSRAVDRLPLLPDAERQQLLQGWNRTEAPYPRQASLPSLVEAHAVARPDAPAVVHGERQLSYAQLNAQANQLAHGLVQRGVRPGARVAVLLERSIEMVVAQLAVLKAGAAFVTLDRHAPQARQRYIVQDCGAQLLLCEAGLELPEVEGVQQLVLARLAAELAQQPQEDLGLAVDAESVAHITYTSGSTGQPKGVMVPHRAIARVALNNGWAELGEGDRFGYISNPAWDANTLELWVPLLNGACVVAIEQREVLDPEAFKRRLLQQEVNVLWLTVGLFNQYAQALGEVFRRLRYLLVGGDALDARVVAQVLRDSPPQHLVNGYGPTETTVFATTWEIRELDAQARGVPIGRPIANTSIYLLDGQGEPVPVGATGEICIGGDGVTLGYLNQPELTAERFVRDPFSSRPGARMYKSGDLGRWRADGVLEFVGRNDHQVKIRGFRIELGEIEARLVQHPGVREAVVLVRQDEPGAKRLVAYVIPAGEAVPEAEALRSHLSQQLPEYMVPAAYVVLQQLPLTINGKLDRQALPVPEAGAYASRRYEAPQGEVEATLARLWCELLKVERVGRQDNFFELGGHSLLAVTLIERMRQAGLHAKVSTLFGAASLAALAAAVDSHSELVAVPPNRIPAGAERITPEMLTLLTLSEADIESIVAAVPGGAANVQDIYPLAPLQEGMLFHHLMVADGDPYLVHAVYAFDSRARVARYLEALQAVIDRHDILRTAIRWEGLREPVQVVWRQARLLVEEVQLDPAEGDATEQLRARFDLQHWRHRIDIRQAPLMRVSFAHDSQRQRWVLLLLLHHLAVDHTALELLQQEVQAHLLGQAGRLAEPLPFRNFVAQARQRVSREEHERFFRGLLGDVMAPTAPYGLSNVHGDGTDIHSLTRRLDSALGRRLRERARALGVSTASLWHAAYALVLARAAGTQDVVFGTVLFGRMQGGEGADRVLGLFINTLPLRVRLGECEAQDTVRQTHALLAQLLRHEHAPLVLAQGCSGVDPEVPLFSALLNYRHDSVETEAATAEARKAWQGIELLSTDERTNYPLILSIDDLGHDFLMTTQVQAPVDPQRVCGMMEQALRSLVEALEDAPQTPVGQLEVMPEVERQLVLQGWNQTAQRVPEDLCLHELVEVQAARQPAAVAVVHGERRLSYGELNEQANRLAHELRRLGVKPDERVGLCCERGLELAVGLLAVLKAGGAYVPLDPAYPKERLQYMLQDSAPVVVLVQGLGRERIDAAVPVLDLQDAAGWVHQPSSNPSRSAIGLQPSHLAYVIYTSGSTGQPKGVAIEHRNAVNFLSWAAEAFDAEQLEHTLWATSVNFDLAVYEYFAPLSVGTTVEVVGNALEAGQATGEVTLINTVPSALQALLESDQVPASVKTVNLAGEALKRSLVEALFERTGVEQVCNLYGPSETTTYSTWVEMKREDGFVPHIGRPIANTQIYLLDAQGRPVPVGVPGEIHIGGAGVARGYLNRPELTAERFLKDPFASDPQARMYKTGDLGRWLADGQLEYLGRNDHQVKIRGFRIELGEIEARLAQHGSVREAVVLAREDQPGDKRLVAYVTPQWQADENEARRLGHEQVADWSRVWAQTYEQTPEAQDAEFDHFGWNSSYTRLPIPEVQMREWLQGAVGRIQALRPRRVLEIGVGSGMILYGVAPQCERYVGTDLSARTVQQLSRRLQADERLRDRTQVVQAQAADFTGVKGQGGYDTVILNSVLQYFPSLQYLQEVVEQAVEVLDEAGGQLFIGDVRHHGLQEVFQLSVQLYQAPPELPLGQLAGRVAQKVKGELELLVEPEWFVQLKQRQPRIRQVQVLPKQSGYHNEMSAYRYDVVVEVGPAGTAEAPVVQDPPVDWIDARELDGPALLAKLEAAAQPVTGLYAVRNRWVERDVAALQRLRSASSEASAGELRESLQAQAWSGLGCEELASWCRERGWSVEFSWYPSRADGAWHAVVSRDGRKVQPDWSQLSDPSQEAGVLANDPLRAKRLAALPEQLRQHLLGQLPEYMVPAAYVVLEALPLTPNGKLDRQALPAPEGAGQGLREYELPVGEVESCLAQIWAELLKVERVGRHDHFFELGGHSLLAVRMASRLRQALGVEVGLAALFERPVLSAFAQLVKDGTRSELPPIEPVARQPGGQALSFAQQRLWFLSQLEGVSRAYHIPLGYRLVGALQEAALQQALQRIVQRHEALRTTFELVDGVPVQRIAEPQDVQVPLQQHDLRGLAPQQRQQALQQLQQAEADEAFDLKRGPLLRGRLVRLDEQERVLLLTMHHIVSDGWSLEVLTQELAALYQAYSEGRQDEEGVVAELAIQYADYAAWQRCWLSGEVLQAQTAYWQRTLAGAPVLLELPSDRPRPAQQDHRGATVALELEAGLTQALKALSQRHGTTLFMTVLTAWAVVLARLSGQAEVVIGTPVANRQRSEVEPLIGFFANTLALRVDVSGAPSVGQLLQRVKARTLDAQHHQDLPFEQVVELVKPPRSLAHSPLFQVACTWQNTPPAPMDLGGVTLTVLPPQDDRAKFDLSLDLGEQGGRIAGSIDYATALFDRATVERYAGYVRHTLAAMVEDEQQPVDRLQVMPPAEWQLVLRGWNETAQPVPQDVCLHELVEAQAARQPAAVAVVHGERHLSYGELNEQANRLAHELRRLGVKPDERVGLCCERGLELAVGLLAVLKAGGAYVPLDPAYPKERLQYMLQDSAPVVVLVQGLGRERIDAAVPVLDLQDAAGWVHQPSTNPSRQAVGLQPSHLAYVIYTSGSTGQPKGVAIEHRNAVNFLSWAAEAFDAEQLKHTLWATSVNFDLAVYEYFAPLSVGTTVEVVGNALEAGQATGEVTLINTVPSALQALLESDQVPASVKTVNLAGEALKRSLVEALFERTGVEQVCNLYGPSETTTYSTWVEMKREDGFVPHIGRPIANTQIYLLDAQGRPVPVGVPGEIHIGGAGVARGYLNRPELTAERFLKDPFASDPQARMYKTGDLGRWLADGQLEYLGRNDHQVKIRGFRIELGEIEARLAQHAGVREAVVLAREDQPGDKRLVAYVTAQPGAALEAEVLRGELSQQLPEYMVPVAYVVLEQLPLTPNGKVDRRALPAPGEGAWPGTAYEAPVGEVEATLAQIWSELLSVERVGRHDNFFELGGHSLLAVKVASRMREQGLHADMSALFATPTLAQFVAATEQVWEVTL
ncbi:non-ribosomal peptide synthetase [Eleftheria terrae]|uniref:non-ribosomal peptide synthetase n=1 Tax=Eleftheria terrae TaxID=1597781 RepID=UPI00263BE710|nr:non-ribosomal peptide synthetase [Eleftheria terrae]WKB55697.1 amino acid adenylation domain-containing protein [Eleftheria terrae]